MEKGRAYCIGLDFGSASVRCLVVDCADGREIGTAVSAYPSGVDGVLTDVGNPYVARQNPRDYLECMASAVRSALGLAAREPCFGVDKVAGIGVDTTASTPIPVDASLVPLAFQERFAGNLDAQAWMWKDHSSSAEAARITELAASMRPEYLAKCGMSYSCECYWAKILHCRNHSPEVFDAAAGWLEFADFIPATLCGVTALGDVKLSTATAGHKGLYSESWGGYPDDEFLAAVDPALVGLKARQPGHAVNMETLAGRLCGAWAARLGLPAGVPVAVGVIDAHMGALGAGVGNGRMAKILGTSGVDVIIADEGQELPDIPGILSLVHDSIMPHRWCTEAGQSAVGDLFNWFVKTVCKGDAALFGSLTAEASALRPGQSGLLALDWQNGSRSVVIDPKLSGLILGMTLNTTQAEIYRALIEATAFNARAILELQESYGLNVREVIACGGIAEKNPMLMQIYADVLNRRMLLAGSGEACALGAAIAAMVGAGVYPDVPSAQANVCSFKDTVYEPVPENAAVYDRLYAMYMQLHRSFGLPDGGHYALMKELFDVKENN